ncbi:hypothetical protein Tco_0255233 [Tanacetum coccineum]
MTIAGGSGKGSKDHSQDQGQNLVPVWNRFIKYSVSLISEAFYVQVDAIAVVIDFGATNSCIESFMKLQLLTHHSKMLWLKEKNKALKEMVNSMLSSRCECEGGSGEKTSSLACNLLNKVPNKRNKTTPYELWYKK